MVEQASRQETVNKQARRIKEAWNKLQDGSNCTPEEKASAKTLIEKILAKYNLGIDWKTGKVTDKQPKAAGQPKQDAPPKQDAQKNTASSGKGGWTTADLAAYISSIIGKPLTPKNLRRVLRANWYNDGKTTHYSWTGKDDPKVKDILDYFKAKVG